MYEFVTKDDLFLKASSGKFLLKSWMVCDESRTPESLSIGFLLVVVTMHVVKGYKYGIRFNCILTH